MSDWDEAVTTMADVVARDFRSALSKAADAKERTYYDADHDRAAAEAYYRGTDLDHLGVLIRSTHRDAPRYKPSLELYPWVDLQPDGKLKSLYTAEIFEPEQLIEADFVVLQERAARMIRLKGWRSATPPPWKGRSRRSSPSTVSTWSRRAGSGSTSRCAATCITSSRASPGATASAATPPSPTSPTSLRLPSPMTARTREQSATTAGRVPRTGSNRHTARARRPGQRSTSGSTTPSTSPPRRCPTTGGQS